MKIKKVSTVEEFNEMIGEVKAGEAEYAQYMQE